MSSLKHVSETYSTHFFPLNKKVTTRGIFLFALFFRVDFVAFRFLVQTNKIIWINSQGWSLLFAQVFCFRFLLFRLHLFYLSYVTRSMFTF